MALSAAAPALYRALQFLTKAVLALMRAFMTVACAGVLGETHGVRCTT